MKTRKDARLFGLGEFKTDSPEELIKELERLATEKPDDEATLLIRNQEKEAVEETPFTGKPKDLLDAFRAFNSIHINELTITLTRSRLEIVNSMAVAFGINP